VGNPGAPGYLGLSPQMDFPMDFTLSHEEVFAITKKSGFNTFALCHGPLFADDFETDF